MKKLMKYSWIVALLVALSLAIFGCGGSSGDDDDDDDDGEYAEVFNLHDYLTEQGLTAGTVLDNTAGTGNIGPGLDLCGSPTITVRNYSGKLGLEVLTPDPGTSYGRGIDFLNSYLEFEKSDKITFTGTADEEGTRVNLDTAAEYCIGTARDGKAPRDGYGEGDFSDEIILKAADIKQIAAASGGVFRIQLQKSAATFEIHTFTVERLEEPEELGEEVEPFEIDVEFTAGMLTAVGGTIAVIDNGAGFEFTYDGTSQYGGSVAVIKVELEDGLTIDDITEISFTVNMNGTGNGYKRPRLYGKPSVINSAVDSDGTVPGVDYLSAASDQSNQAPASNLPLDTKFIIGSGASTTGVVETAGKSTFWLGITMHCGATDLTSFTISDVKFTND